MASVERASSQFHADRLHGRGIDDLARPACQAFARNNTRTGRVVQRASLTNVRSSPASGARSPRISLSRVAYLTYINCNAAVRSKIINFLYPEEEMQMAVARVTEITAASAESFQEAAQEGLERATKTLRGVTGFEVISMKGKVENGKISEYRVTLEVTFILE